MTGVLEECHLDQNRLEPVLSARSEPAITTRTKQEPTALATFSADTSDGADLIGNQALLAQVAELALHRRTQTPMTIGLFGPAGCGKSHFLRRFVNHARALAASAGNLGRSPLIADLAIIELSAAALHGHPTTCIAAALYEGLARADSAQPGLAAAAGDAVHAATDPDTATREATQRLDEARHRLEGERRALDGLDGKKARLVDTVLYETAGSRIDVFARSNRARIDARLKNFGFSGEPVQIYKDLVRDVAEQDKTSSRIWVFLRSLWVYNGQVTLIVWSAVFLLTAWVLGIASETRATWIPLLRN